MKKYFLKFRQLDCNGKEQEYTEAFENIDARKNFIKQLDLSSKHLNLPFEVVDTWEK